MGIKQKIRDYFSKTISAQVKDEDDVFSLGVVDSLFALQLVLFVEQEFDVQVEGDDLNLDHFCTINAIHSFVEAKRALVSQ
ncbi:acyl carrier protein [Massilia pseudoviolaceinigra]|uniref:acyl carrier protein n=1 Tax=Massilia pseudoviolaceinigra TaxID=3057165 RepID=UPI00279640E7|nr:acyl carrier protein [Massilia sp. CCM 9206]MDQ1920914.1 acyl carrier protein [Massilia sp. CCM 9206]